MKTFFYPSEQNKTRKYQMPFSDELIKDFRVVFYENPRFGCGEAIV
ncbi:MAG: hypothetical protein HLUCCX10_11965 [Algoriphagus marincola HL-49]|uniref:Uncharacterized protein n=1 Tax=Algoriphagus marincola HL-49 TaxID=1305737 RepID=A0A0P8AEH3_9BACT|nr:MAG: hypothetical protein HLUCCX10_11965 [Algoriphagus marincola HL-49]